MKSGAFRSLLPSTAKEGPRLGASGVLLVGMLTAGPVAGQSAVGFARPVGAWSAPGYASAGPIGGPLLGVESGGALLMGTDGSDPHAGLALGAYVGWAFPQGIALHLRYDDLGIRVQSGSPPLQLATAGLRYTAPFLVPLPFAEVDAGTAFVAKGVAFGAAGGLGLSVPLGSHVLVDVVGRDWLLPVAGVLRQTLTASLGLSVTFASASH